MRTKQKREYKMVSVFYERTGLHCSGVSTLDFELVNADRAWSILFLQGSLTRKLEKI